MSYRVIWTRVALRELARLCLQRTRRTAITRATHVIERLLMLDPSNEGVPRGKGIRRLFVTPLFVEFKVDEQDQSVSILRARLTP